MNGEQAVLVTGAAGLIGNAVCELLERRGTRVVAIDRIGSTAEQTPIVQCDLTDIHRLHSIVRGENISGIVHCGAYSGPMVSRDNPYAIVQVNILGTANVLEVARIYGIKRFVFCSSTSAYGNTPKGPVREDVPLAPTSVYGASKAAGEQLVSSYSIQHGIDGVSLRLSWVYGPRRTTDCTIRTMIEDALAHRPTRIPWGRDFHRQYIHVEDAAEALVTALDVPSVQRRVYTVTGGTYATLHRIGELVRHVIPSADIQLGPGPDPGDDVQEEFDITAARQDLDFRPKRSLEDGIRSYAGWLSQKTG
jgi:nucleoside-diphosphate-sugar epimerase